MVSFRNLSIYIYSRHSGVNDPSWAELKNFVGFLNTQLLDYEQSDYVSDAAAEFLPGFAEFVLKFLIQMSRVCITFPKFESLDIYIEISHVVFLKKV